MSELIKIGCGNFAKVYKQKINDIYFAVKIPRSKLTKSEAKRFAEEEVHMLKKFKDSNYILNLITYKIDNIDVRLTFELLGNELDDVINHYYLKGEKMPLTVVKHYARSILYGLKEIKDANILHNDIKPQNILLRKKIPKIFNIKFSEYSDKIIEIVFSSYILDDSIIDEYLYRKDVLLYIKSKYDLCREILLLNIDTKISDFGNGFTESMRDDKLTRYDHLPSPTCNYSPPECILGINHWVEADMWSFGCIVYELLTGYLLFDPCRNNNMGVNSNHILNMIEIMGPVPTYLISSGTKSKKYFIRNIHRFNYLLNKRRDLTDLLTRKMFPKNHIITDTDRKSIKEVSEFLLRIFTFDQTKRITPEDCIKEEFLKKRIKFL